MTGEQRRDTDAPGISAALGRSRTQPVLVPSTADGLADATGALFLATCTPGHDVDVGVAVANVTVGVHATGRVRNRWGRG